MSKVIEHSREYCPELLDALGLIVAECNLSAVLHRSPVMSAGLELFDPRFVGHELSKAFHECITQYSTAEEPQSRAMSSQSEVQERMRLK